MKEFIVLAGGIYQLPLIKALKAKGLFVVLFDADPDAVGFDFCDAGVVVDIGSPKDCLKAAKKFSNIVGVASIVNEISVMTVATMSEKLSIFGIGIETAKKSTNKYLMRKSFSLAGMRTPQFDQVKTIIEAEKFIQASGLPAVIKPVDSSGSRGVKKIDSIDKLTRYFNEAQKESRCNQVILESFLDGIEYTVETYSINGVTYVLGFSQKSRVPFPACVSVELQYMPYETHLHGGEIVESAISALKAVGLKDGPSHIEVILTKNGPYVVEIAARGGGFRIFPEIIEAISGVDPIALMVEQALGGTPVIEKSRNHAAVLRFLQPKKWGVIKAIEGIERARKVTNVVDVVLEKNLEGKFFNGINKDGDRPGYILSIAKTIDQALYSTDAADKMISFTLE